MPTAAVHEGRFLGAVAHQEQEDLTDWCLDGRASREQGEAIQVRDQRCKARGLARDKI